MHSLSFIKQLHQTMQRATVYSAAVISMFLWSFTFIWYKLVLDDYSPISVALIRLVISSALLSAVLLILGKFTLIKRKDIRNFILLSLFQPFGYFLGETFGVKEVSPTIAAVMISTIPVLTPLASRMFLKEKLGIVNIIGIIVSFSGILLMVMKSDLSFEASPVGMLLLMLAVVSAIGYSIVIRRLSSYYKPVMIVTWHNIIGVIMFLPLFFIFDFNHFISVRPDANLLLNLGYLAVFGSSVAFVLYVYGISHLGPSKANVFTNTIPIFAAITSYFVLGEEMTTKKVLGIAIVLSGVFLSQLGSRTKR